MSNISEGVAAKKRPTDRANVLNICISALLIAVYFAGALFLLHLDPEKGYRVWAFSPSAGLLFLLVWVTTLDFRGNEKGPFGIRIYTFRILAPVLAIMVELVLFFL